MAVTMHDIARHSGVSIATVSKYVNGGQVRQQNRLNIERAIEELGYRVNVTARALKTDRTMTVGVIMEHLSNMFYTSVLSTMEDLFQESGYSSIICETQGKEGMSLKKLDVLLSKRVDGVVYFSSRCETDFIRACGAGDVPLTVVDCLPPEEETGLLHADFADYVLTDNRGGAAMAARYLLERGHRKIGIITGHGRHYSAKERLAGFSETLAAYGAPLADAFCIIEDYDVGGGYRAARQLCAGGDLPTAVLVCNYFMNLGAMVAFNEQNLKIGEDISVVSFDEIHLNRAFRPEIATVEQSLSGIGTQAARCMLERLNASSGPPARVIRIPALLKKRGSVAALPGFVLP